MEKLKHQLAEAESSIDTRKKPPATTGPPVVGEGLVIDEWVSKLIHSRRVVCYAIFDVARISYVVRWRIEPRANKQLRAVIVYIMRKEKIVGHTNYIVHMTHLKITIRVNVDLYCPFY